jgi:protein-disulfide isomerase
MRKSWIGLIVAAALSLIAGSGPAPAEEALTPEQKQAVEQTIRDYILAHPEIVRDALLELQRQQQEAEQVARQGAIAELHDYVATLPADYVKGDPGAETAVIEFFDYRCPYCKAVSPTIDGLVAEDPEVRVVLIEYPILGEESLFAARAAVASRAQGKYLLFHDAMMNHKGKLDQDTILELADDVGIDLEKLEADMKSPEIDALIGRHHQLADKLGVTGTPAFIIGQELVPGAIDAETMKAKIKQARQS